MKEYNFELFKKNFPKDFKVFNFNLNYNYQL